MTTVTVTCRVVHTVMNDCNLVHLLAGKLPVYTTSSAYNADEDDEISVPKGVDVHVVKKSITGWWTVKFEGKVGLFPASFLTEQGVDNSVSRGSLKGQRRLVPRK